MPPVADATSMPVPERAERTGPAVLDKEHDWDTPGVAGFSPPNVLYEIVRALSAIVIFALPAILTSMVQ